MLEFDHIVDAVHGLSHEEKFRLRLLLDEELKPPTVPAGENTRPRSELIGLFADEPELMDRVMEAVCERRSRPLRLDQ